MASNNEIVFTLQPHPFKGLTLKATAKGKPLSPYTSGIPNDIRQLLRYVLVHKDISEHLADILDKYQTAIQLQLKVKNSLVECIWDPQLLYEKKVTIAIKDGDVVIHSEGSSDNVIFLSNQFCFIKTTKHLGRMVNSNRAASIKCLAEHSGFKEVSSVIDTTLSVSEFNQLVCYFDSPTEIDCITFLDNDLVKKPQFEPSTIAMNINYDDHSHIVLCHFYYKVKNSQFDVGLHMFKTFAETKQSQVKWTFKQRRVLATWIMYYAKANNKGKERLMSHFLPKIIAKDDISMLSQLLADIPETRYKLFSDDPAWTICEVAYFQECCFWIALGCLFVNYVAIDNDLMSLKLDKEEFNMSLKQLQTLCKHFKIDITYEKKHIEIIKQNLSLDLRNMHTLDDSPLIQFNNEAISYETLIDLKSNLWAYVDDKKVSILDDALIAQCETILEVIEFQRKAFPKTEEFPVQKISHLLDWIQLKAAGIAITLSTEQEKQVASFMSFKSLKPVPVPSLNNAKPREYQKDGLNWMMFLYEHELGAILADDMGLGKTFQSLMLLAAIKEKASKQSSQAKKIPHLIVVPPSLIYNWSHEIERFCHDMSVTIYAGPGREINQEADVVITSYELLRRDYKKLADYEFNVAIFDEAQFIKNHMSARTKAAQQIKRKFCLCLTGTPIENNVGEYITILNTILPGFFPYSKQLVSSITEQHVGLIVKRSKPFVLRRLKNQISHELKPKTEEDIFLTMSPNQEKLYQSLVVAIRKQVTGLKKEKGKSIAIFTALMRLRQACVSPYLIDDTFDEVTPKFTFLIEKLNVLRDEGHSVLVFSQFIKSLDIIEGLCKEANLPYFRLDGSVSAIKRKQYIDAFQASDTPQVFLMSLKAGGVGLNLTKASYVFHLDPWWNPAVENQATDRVHRIGQEQRVFSYKLIMHNSIEEKIQEIKEKKSALFNMLLDESVIVNRSDVLSADDFLWLLET